MSHYTQPRYKKNLAGEKFIKYGQTCADYLEFKYTLDENKIINLHFDAKGCAFMIASTDLLIEHFIGKNKEQILNFIDKYENFIKNGGNEQLENELGKLAIFKNVNEHPNRYFCATLFSSAIKEKLNE
ncbi:hypothetical protein EG856_01445 [Mycoplasmopsis phocirhinis]|uniref:NIF system FeS cluster assembly NifU N-terminal domain-containing protein n=1 Tax=Mycoplasmopsis phocirhinis TaxID=142650 RepID=A0A4P6MPD2_9BACT|nr:iron-sulfur cluster assembly scaffold protein [Mycoplasmopsis phocirhinis]QBF34586.1 hypothetical protein EG856_01445 [Mycoplasmopsis phocirhinis]